MNHQHRKIAAREDKENYKAKDKNKGIYKATIDLQAVLTPPCTLIGELCYTHKLFIYKLLRYGGLGQLPNSSADIT